MSDEIKEKVKDLFDQVASLYDNPAMRFFPFCGDRMISHLQPKPGFKVLDIATGTGAVALPAAQAIAPTGRVQAIDLAENMLDIAAANLKRAGIDNVDFHAMDATRLDFKSRYFDAITCSFGIFFLPDMLAALKEWVRVLKPGGLCYFAAENRIRAWDGHYNLPLVTMLPKPVADLCVRVTGRGQRRYETHRTVWGLRRLTRNFEIIDYTRAVVRDPERFEATEMVWPGSPKQRIARAVLAAAYWAFPTYLWILRKPSER